MHIYEVQLLLNSTNNSCSCCSSCCVPHTRHDCCVCLPVQQDFDQLVQYCCGRWQCTCILNVEQRRARGIWWAAGRGIAVAIANVCGKWKALVRSNNSIHNYCCYIRRMYTYASLMGAQSSRRCPTEADRIRSDDDPIRHYLRQTCQLYQ